MLKTILALFAITASFSIKAQTAADFTITDIDGISRNLYTELDANNVVVLKFFTNWCSICNGTADEVVAIYNAYQTNGDLVVFWALDRDQAETNVQATTYRDNHSIPFPVIGEAYTIAQQFGVVYQPEYYIIRPDRNYVLRTSYSTMNTAVDEALLALGTSNPTVGRNAILVAADALTWMAPSTETGRLNVVDVTGRTVITSTLNGNDRTTLGELPTGVYMYTLHQGTRLIAQGKVPMVR